MAQKIVAGNWKMNLDRTQAGILISEICGMLDTEDSRPVQVLLFPSFIHIGMAVQMAASEPRIRIGAQNCSSHVSGAFTGEVSASMLRSAGCSHVLVGHSERRMLFNENNDVLAEKTIRVLEEEMTPVFCIGELLSERENGVHFEVIKNQLTEGLFHLSKSDFSKCIIAYEPVWAIGTGLSATSEQAEFMHKNIWGVAVPDYIFTELTAVSNLDPDSIESLEAQREIGLKFSQQICKRVQELGFKGIHLMAIGQEANLADILKRIMPESAVF
jgi:triosephosphate isomerase